MNKWRSVFIGLLVSICCWYQIALMTFRRMAPPQGTFNEGWLFILGILIALLPLLWVWIVSNEKNSSRSYPIWLSLILMGIFTGGLIYLVPDLTQVFETYPISLTQSDIIPQIEWMVRKFFWEGETPYQTFTDFGYPLFSPYMPLHWGPFFFSELLQFDDRWVAIGIWGIVSLVFIWKIGQSQVWMFVAWIPALFPVYYLYQIIQYEPHVLGHTVEILIAAYYMLLALSVLSKSPVFRAVGILLCLLSRYSLVLWLPLYAFIVWKEEGKKHALTVMGITAVGVLIIYVFPFWVQDITIFSQGLSHHVNVSQKAWSYEPWFTPEGRPGVLSWGVGLGRYFFDLWPGEPIQRLKALTLTQVLGSLSISLIMGLLYPMFRHKIDHRLFLLLSLQLYLTMFYHLYALPFIYYMMVPVMVSMVVGFAAFNLDEYLVYSKISDDKT